MGANTVKPDDVMHAAPQDARPLRFGIDIGGSKIEIVALERDGTERLRRRASTVPSRSSATASVLLPPRSTPMRMTAGQPFFCGDG